MVILLCLSARTSFFSFNGGRSLEQDSTRHQSMMMMITGDGENEKWMKSVRYTGGNPTKLGRPFLLPIVQRVQYQKSR